MGTTIDQLQIEIETKSEGAERRVNALTSSLERLNKATKSSGLDKTVKKLEKIASLKFSNLNSLNKIKNSTASMKTVKARVKNATPAISSIPAEIKTTVDSGGISDTVDKIETATSAIKNIPKKVDIPVEAPGVESTNSKLSLAQKVLSGVKTTALTVGAKIVSLGKRFKTFGTTALASCKQSLKGLTQLLKIVVIYGGAFRAYMLFTQGISEGLQNIAKYSDETATSMNKLSTMSLYLKNSIGAAMYPIIVQITPALEAMANAIIRALNAFNQFIAAWGGSTTFIKAKSYLKEYGETATKTAEKIKKSFAGMDEITVIGNKDDGGSGSSTPDYSQMFETVPVSSKTSAIVDNIKQNLDQVKILLGGAALAVGAILTFSGASIPLGLALMVVGAVSMASGISENWNAMGSTLKDKFSNIMYVISGAMLVVGAILAFSGVATGLGIALMMGGALTMATAGTENWEGLSQDVKNVITTIGLIVGTAFLVLGAILAFSGAGIPLGIGLMLAGASLIATAAVLGWDKLPDNIKNTLSSLLIILSTALLVVGAVLAFTGAALPLGIALMVLGVVGIVAGASKVDWEWMKEKINTIIASILAILSSAGLALGILLCLSGAGIPQGISLIIASIKGVKAASDMDDNPITKFVKKMVNGIIGIFESGINYIVNMLNKLSFNVPDWVPGIGGSTFGFNIKPVKIPRLKDGGFPDGEDGLFFANHNELVGKFSNGKTAVANNDQIVEGIRSGVYDANQEQNNLLREQNKLLRQLLNKESGAEVNISTITKAQNRMNQRHGKTIVPVGT